MYSSMHFLTGEELNQTELSQILQTAESLKKARGSDGDSKTSSQALLGKTIALIFEKPSLRTRVSFTVGVQELGGYVMELLSSQRKTEEPEDTIRVLQGMVHGIMLRTFDHRNLERMVSHATIPVINGLSDSHHPCQALADLLTLQECFGHLKGLKLAYMGDGNNVLHSLLLMAPYLGVDLHYSCPKGFEPDSEILARANERAKIGGGRILSFSDPKDAANGVHALYTDVWTSMGQESEKEQRTEAFKPYQLNLELLKLAEPNAIIMHCLPMVRGLEITDEMADHERSAIFRQSENRLHAQKALMLALFEAAKSTVAKGKAAHKSNTKELTYAI